MKHNSIIVIDFSHLSSRMLYVAVSQAHPKKKNGKFITSDFVKYYKHLIFNSLQSVNTKFKGDIIIAMDGRDNWRKKFYPLYKAHRAKDRDKSEINFAEYYEELDKVANALENYFPYKVIKVDEAEADDIAGVISNTYGNEMNITLVTSDHDWQQVQAENDLITFFDPIKRLEIEISADMQEIIDTPEGKMSRFTVIHTLLGDDGDNVPGVVKYTEFSDSFISFLKENGIYDVSVKNFHKLSMADELLQKFDVYKVVKSGKKKGQFSDIKDIYKTKAFGKVKAEKVSQNSETLNKFLDSDEMYRDNFKRNAVLVDFNKIPKFVEEKILQEYKTKNNLAKNNKILEYFINEGLGEMVQKVHLFYGDSDESSLDDFLEW